MTLPFSGKGKHKTMKKSLYYFWLASNKLQRPTEKSLPETWKKVRIFCFHFMTLLQGGGNLLIPVSSNCFIHCYNKPAIVCLFPRYPSPEMLNILLPAQAGTHCFQFNAKCSRDERYSMYCCKLFVLLFLLYNTGHSDWIYLFTLFSWQATFKQVSRACS